MNVKIKLPEHWDIFNPRYPESTMRKNQMRGKYVSDCITEATIREWETQSSNRDFYSMTLDENLGDLGLLSSQAQYPYFVGICAPTGKGKNYFFTHILCKYAYDKHRKVLYLCNRSALDYQQKKELAEMFMQKVSPDYDGREDEVCTIGNVTLMTYQALVKRINDKNWTTHYNFVVLDECHFFYSDAYFNSSTWALLEKIIDKFATSIRIYMSATFENVFEIIRYMEGNAVRIMGYKKYHRSLLWNIDCNPNFYEFERDYSQYNIVFFSNCHSFDSSSEYMEISGMDNACTDEAEAEGANSHNLLERICADRAGKTVIFVTGKETGKKLEKDIYKILKKNGKNTEDQVIYIDKDSRRSTNRKERDNWYDLLEKGMFDGRVLITTSVLDNGFSIKDKAVKNIVLYTDDQTEFLQELGRVRLTEGDRVNLYIKKTSASDIARLTTKYNYYYPVVARCCEDEPHLLNPEIRCTLPVNEVACAYSLCTIEKDERRAFFSFPVYMDEFGRIQTGDPKFNKMVCWRLRKLGEMILKYKEYEEEYGEDAGKYFKLHWLFPGAESAEEYEDLDNVCCAQNTAKMEELLLQYEGKELVESESEYKDFAQQFRGLYISLLGSVKINRSTKREIFGHVALNRKLEELKPLGIDYNLLYKNGKCTLRKQN